VLWEETTYPVQPVGGGTTVIHARRFDRNGAALGNTFDVATMFGSGWLSTTVSVAWNGSEFVVAYAGPGRSGGAVIDGTVLAVASDNQVRTLTTLHASLETSVPILALAGRNGGALLVWNDDSQLKGAIIGSTAGDPHLVDPSSAAQDDPRVAFCGDMYRVAWAERSNRSRIVFGRVRANGIPLGGAGRPVSDSDQWQSAPNIACNATNALVTWAERDLASNVSKARAAIVDADGIAHPSIDLGFMRGSTPAVLWNGSEYLAVWQAADSREIQIARLDRDGQSLMVRTFRNARGVLGDASPSIAWNGSEYLAAWAEESVMVQPQNYAEPQTLHSIRAVRLSRELTVLGTARAISVQPDEKGADAGAPLAIAGDRGWLVAWRQREDFATFKYSEYYATLSPELDVVTAATSLGTPDYNPLSSDGAFRDGFYRLVFSSTLVSIGSDVEKSGLDDVVAISHGGALLVHRHISDELLPLLYVSGVGRARPSRH